MPEMFTIAEWKVYRHSRFNLLKIIQKDDEYLEELVIDLLTVISRTNIQEQE